MDVVVVESPAKAKTINKYLGDKYRVLASYGHVRDLPAKDGSVRPDADFAMDWEIDAKAAQRVGEIARAVKGAQHLYPGSTVQTRTRPSLRVRTKPVRSRSCRC